MKDSFYKDSFDLKEAFNNIREIITAPTAFFTALVGASGLKSAKAMILIYSIIICVASGLVAMFRGNITALVWALIGIPIWWGLMIVGVYISAVMLYASSRIFGAQGSINDMYRVIVFSDAPYVILASIGYIAAGLSAPSAVAMQQVTGGSLFSALFVLIGIIWTVSFLIKGIKFTHRLSTRQAFCTIMIPNLILVAIVMTLGSWFPGILTFAHSSTH